MVEQSVDYRLNPALQRGCSQDIGKFCLSLMKNHVPDVEFEGKILNCLKVRNTFIHKNENTVTMNLHFYHVDKISREKTQKGMRKTAFSSFERSCA